jgi:tetratricopeptide (TPR) repeat protein
MIKKSLLPGIIFLFILLTGLNAQNDEVSVKVFKQVFPTYNMGPDDPNTYFKDFAIPGMNFFRSSRSVYPYSFVNDYRPGKQDLEYEVVRLENDLIYIDIIPQLRGRIQGAVDKRNNWDFLYYNHVIKPAEIAVRSAWISGGLEYNHPGGHGYTQFSKISYDIIEGKDGSQTVVVAEIEPIRMMKWEYEITLRPGELFVETRGRFISTVPYKVPFLSSNNAAMHVTDEMELIYPQNTHASGHGFEGLKKWSAYSPDGSDWDWVKNIKRALSTFADGSGILMDYWGVYSHDEGIDAGSVVIADHRVAPGKKYFTWGTSESGKQWDHFLSDEDGGYVELQQQAYCTNLGYGYAVLDPLEVKEFSIYWYPIKGTGGFVKASKEVAVNFKRLDDQKVRLDIQPTMNLSDVTIQVYKNSKLEQKLEMDLQVGEVYNKELKLLSSEKDTLKVRILDNQQRDILLYADKIAEVKPVVNRIPKKDISEYTIDQLYHKAITNYQDAYGTEANMYINEILSRDPMESRANRLSGIIGIKRGQYAEAIKSLEKSLKTDHFENCYESWGLMGYSYLQLGDLDKAHEYLVQSSRKRSELDHSLYYLAQTELRKGEYHEALRMLKQIPLSTGTHPNVFNLMAYTLRKLGDHEVAGKMIKESFTKDPLNFVGYIEKLELGAENGELVEKINFIFDRKEPLFVGSQLYLETAIHYMGLGDYELALKVLNIAEEHYQNNEVIYPFVNYYKGYCLLNTGNREQAMEHYRKASRTDHTYVFPYRPESLEVLRSVLTLLPGDAVANMYYGDLLYYLRRHDEAFAAWDRSYEIDPENFRVSRNLALGKYIRSGNMDETVRLLEESFEQSGKNLRIFAELEALYISQKRFGKLESHYDENLDIIYQKGDYAIKAADFYIGLERYNDAANVLKKAYFSAAERALGKPVRHTRYVEAQIGLAEGLIAEKEYGRAIAELKEAYEYPDYLNEARVNNPITTRVDYYLALAYKMDKQKDLADEFFRRAIDLEINPVSVATIYKALALKETGRKKEGEKLVRDMLDQIERGPAESNTAIHEYLKSLGYSFLGEKGKAEAFKNSALKNEYNVVMMARYESSFLHQKKFAME